MAMMNWSWGDEAEVLDIFPWRRYCHCRQSGRRLHVSRPNQAKSAATAPHRLTPAAFSRSLILCASWMGSATYSYSPATPLGPWRSLVFSFVSFDGGDDVRWLGG